MNQSEEDGRLTVLIKDAPNKVAVIKHIREATNLSLTEIKTAISNQSPISIANLFGVDHEEKESNVRQLFKQLDDASVEFEIFLNNDLESRQYFEDAMKQWREIETQTERMTDLESGQPSIETLQWLKDKSTPDVFRQTLRQIIDGQGYDVDLETMEWAIRQINEP